MSVEVRLTRDELLFAAQGAMVRNVDALLKGRRSIFGDPHRELWINNVVGAIGECAAAKHYGRYWTPCYEQPTGVSDLRPGEQVRATTRTDGGLRLYERDRDDHAFLLVVVRAPVCHLVGWLRGRDGKRDEWGRNTTGERQWLVPQRALRPISVLSSGQPE